MLTTALVRPVPDSFAASLCLHRPAAPIDVARARAQHAAYVAALRRCVPAIIELPAAPTLPDSCFIEDTAIVIGHRALLTHPGAPSRRAEVAATAAALRALDVTCQQIEPPATIDGGDVLVSGATIFAGLSRRTSPAALAVLRAAFPDHSVVPIPVAAGLHLKSAITQVGPRHFLIEDSPTGRSIWEAVAPHLPGEQQPIFVDEAHAANALRLGDALIHLAGRPRLREALHRADLGAALIELDMSELEKADGGLTCLSIPLELH